MKQLALFLVAAAIISCTSTMHITSSWVRPSTATTHNYTNFMVLALAGDNNPGLQQKLEESMAADLRSRGYNANSYFDEFGPKAMDKTDEQGTIHRLRTKGADAILTIVLLDTANEHYYVPGTVEYEPLGYYHRFWGYYSNIYDVIYTPGYYTSHTRYFWETNLYDADNEDLVYSVRTESFDPSSTQGMALEYGRKVVRDMVKQKIIR